MLEAGLATPLSPAVTGRRPLSQGGDTTCQSSGRGAGTWRSCPGTCRGPPAGSPARSRPASRRRRPSPRRPATACSSRTQSRPGGTGPRAPCGEGALGRGTGGPASPGVFVTTSFSIVSMGFQELKENHTFHNHPKSWQRGPRPERASRLPGTAPRSTPRPPLQMRRPRHRGKSQLL